MDRLVQPERAVRKLRDGTFDLYQLDATAYPGNSGGPLLPAETGEAVGSASAHRLEGFADRAAVSKYRRFQLMVVPRCGESQVGLFRLAR
ncbi:hypothetical protein B4Q13_15240 [Lacticaseibacillus rhamnosus]